MRFQYTQLPNGSFSGTPSASTSVRLDPDPATPRSVTPCVVGFATRDEDRRNSVNPGVERSASSKAPAAMLLSSADVNTVELAALGSRSAPRVAVTTTESAKLTGRRITFTGPVPSISTSAVSNPSEATRTRAAIMPASKLPSRSDLTVLVRPSRAVTVMSAAGMTAPEMSTMVPTVLPAVGCWADAAAATWAATGDAVTTAAATRKNKPDCRIIQVDSTTVHSMAEPDRVLLEGPHSRFQELRLLLGAGRDFIRGFRALHFVGPCVTVFGSARFDEHHRYYAMAREVGGALARLGFTVMTGGGPGVMEAANRGAREAGGRSVGCNIQLPLEQAPNAYLDRFVTTDYF